MQKRDSTGGHVAAQGGLERGQTTVGCKETSDGPETKKERNVEGVLEKELLSDGVELRGLGASWTPEERHCLTSRKKTRIRRDRWVRHASQKRANGR